MDSIPQPALYTVIVSMAGVVCYLFKLIITHHANAMNDLRAERAALINAVREQSAAVDRNTKGLAELIWSMVFLPEEVKRNAKKLIQEIEAQEARRQSQSSQP